LYHKNRALSENKQRSNKNYYTIEEGKIKHFLSFHGAFCGTPMEKTFAWVYARWAVLAFWG